MRIAPCDPAFEEVLRSIREQRVSRAGLAGPYATAECEDGRKAFHRALGGRGTYLWGSPGTGKTYAAACALRLWLEAGYPGKLFTAKGLADFVKEGYSEGYDALRRVKSYGLLVIDDLGAERATDWSRELFEDLIDHRLTAGTPTIVTSNHRIGQLRDLWGGVEGQRIASRLAGACEPVEVCGPDRRLDG